MEKKDIVVGRYCQKFNDLTNQDLPCIDIVQSEGLKKHISAHHPGKEYLISQIPQVIACPDYVGKHPKEDDSIELVKQLNENVMVCVKLDIKNGKLYVASVFDISDGKLNNRINSGRLKKC